MNYWERSLDGRAAATERSLWSAYDDLAVERLIRAGRDVIQAANWYSEQSWLLWSLVRDGDADGISEWATEMREEMPDDDDWPQDHCDLVADQMDYLAGLVSAAQAAAGREA